MEDNNNNNKDDNNYKGISALGLDRDLGFSRGHQGHQGRQGHRPHDDDADEEEDDEVEDNDKEGDSLNVLAKTPGIYHVPELRYPYNCCCPC